MKRQTTFSILILLLVLSMAACTRSAATPPPPTPTLGAPAELAFPTPPGGEAANPATATALAAQSMMMQTLAPSGATAVTPTPTSPPPTATSIPPTATSKPKAVPTVSVPSSYTLHRGEYPYCLARRFNIDPNYLLRANGLSRGQVVYPGTVLTIPKNAPPFPGNRAWHAHPTTYTVRYGDTIYSIACYFGDVSPEAIAAANGISVSTPLTPGQTLTIP